MWGCYPLGFTSSSLTPQSLYTEFLIGSFWQPSMLSGISSSSLKDGAALSLWINTHSTRQYTATWTHGPHARPRHPLPPSHCVMRVAAIPTRWCQGSSSAMCLTNTLHCLSHPRDVSASQQLIGDSFMWNGIWKDIAAWVHQRQQCHRKKVHHHQWSTIQHIPMPNKSFSHICVDIVGPLPPHMGSLSSSSALIAPPTGWSPFPCHL